MIDWRIRSLLHLLVLVLLAIFGWWLGYHTYDWGNRWMLLFLILAPLVYFLARRSTSLLGFSSVSAFEHTPRSVRQLLSPIPALLLAAATIVLVIALAQPRTPEHQTKITRDGIAIMAIIDLSSSMDARDMVQEDRSINRLRVARDVFINFVRGGEGVSKNGRPDDLIGMVTFARYADSICPLTLDHGNLVNIVKDLEIVASREEDGTAVGDGLGLAVERLRRSKAKSRVAILLTDGVTNAGVIDPNRAAELANQNDIKVYGIGVGTRGMAPVPQATLFGTRLVAMPVEIDEETLQKIAETTGGRYFRAVDKEALAGIYREIDQLERTEVAEIQYLRYKLHYQVFVIAGIFLIGCAMILNGSIFRRLP